jgi:predicted O-methyltransferase YrrM
MFSDILKKYSAIDTRYGTDKMTSHSYEGVYNELFSNYTNKNINLLEIGFDGGFSLLAYYEYFKNGTIYGIDIQDNRTDEVKSNEKLNITIGDAKQQEIIDKHSIGFDIIIEDASHLLEDQIQHFKDYSKYVNSGGLYIIEDVNQMNYEKVLDETKNIAYSNGFRCQVYDLRHIKYRFDDILIVFFKN